MTSSFIAPKKIKRYKTLEDLMAVFFGCKKSKVPEYELGGTGMDSKVSCTVTYKEFKDAMEYQGIWGFIQQKTKIMHVWFKPDILIEDLVSFIAHEAGHINGHQYKDVDKEESKAMTFEAVSAYAYKNALKILK